jgi:RNA polymerase sigma-70 factor (ECF subfamily)
MTPEPTEPEQFVALLTAAQPALYARILALLPDRAAAADALQETNLVLWRRSADFVPGTQFLAWASRVARYVVLNHRRTLRRSKVVFDDELVAELADRQAADDEAPGAGGPGDRAAALRKCLNDLPADQRELLARRYGPGGSVQRLAEERGQSPGAVSQLLYRVRERLLDCVHQRLAGESPA